MRVGRRFDQFDALLFQPTDQCRRMGGTLNRQRHLPGPLVGSDPADQDDHRAQQQRPEQRIDQRNQQRPAVTRVVDDFLAENDIYALPHPTSPPRYR